MRRFEHKRVPACQPSNDPEVKYSILKPSNLSTNSCMLHLNPVLTTYPLEQLAERMEQLALTLQFPHWSTPTIFLILTSLVTNGADRMGNDAGSVGYQIKQLERVLSTTFEAGVTCPGLKPTLYRVPGSRGRHTGLHYTVQYQQCDGLRMTYLCTNIWTSFTPCTREGANTPQRSDGYST